MEEVASSGLVANWAALRDDLISRVERNIETKFNDVAPFTDPLTGVTKSAPELQAEFCQSLWKFEAAPFTIQRLAELACQPNQHFGRDDVIKYLHALLHNVRVTSTVNDFDEEEGVLDQESESGLALSDIEWAS